VTIAADPHATAASTQGLIQVEIGIETKIWISAVADATTPTAVTRPFQCDRDDNSSPSGQTPGLRLATPEKRKDIDGLPCCQEMLKRDPRCGHPARIPQPKRRPDQSAGMTARTGACSRSA
jgi:hypothetical protein